MPDPVDPDPLFAIVAFIAIVALVAFGAAPLVAFGAAPLVDSRGALVVVEARAGRDASAVEPRVSGAQSKAMPQSAILWRMVRTPTQLSFQGPTPRYLDGSERNLLG